MTDRCFFFGCWNEPGHYLHAPGQAFIGHAIADKVVYYGDQVHLDGSLAPRIVTGHLRNAMVPGQRCFVGSQAKQEDRRYIESRSSECAQGLFFLHHLDNRFTAIQWWDRCQGDTRGACNSTVLLEGKHTSAEMLAALREHFPHVLANLEKAGVVLAEVTL